MGQHAAPLAHEGKSLSCSPPVRSRLRNVLNGQVAVEVDSATMRSNVVDDKLTAGLVDPALTT